MGESSINCVSHWNLHLVRGFPSGQVWGHSSGNGMPSTWNRLLHICLPAAQLRLRAKLTWMIRERKGSNSYLYMYVYAHTYIHTDIQTYRHTNIQTYMHTCIHAYMHTCIHASMHPCNHACMHAHIQTYKHTNIHTYTHTHIQTYKHTDIHTYIYIYYIYRERELHVQVDHRKGPHANFIHKMTDDLSSVADDQLRPFGSFRSRLRCWSHWHTGAFCSSRGMVWTACFLPQAKNRCHCNLGMGWLSKVFLFPTKKKTTPQRMNIAMA